MMIITTVGYINEKTTTQYDNILIGHGKILINKRMRSNVVFNITKKLVIPNLPNDNKDGKPLLLNMGNVKTTIDSTNVIIIKINFNLLFMIVVSGSYKLYYNYEQLARLLFCHYSSFVPIFYLIIDNRRQVTLSSLPSSTHLHQHWCNPTHDLWYVTLSA